MSGTTPVLAFAFSEASFELVDRWSASGQLPTFQRLREQGTWGALQSGTPYITPLMWSTILTGTNPGRHGVFDFWQRGDDGEFREIDRRTIREPCLWDILAKAGRSVGLWNVPLTYPPPKVTGYAVSGQDAPGAHPSVAHPRSLYTDIVQQCGGLPFKEIFPGGRRKADYLSLFDADAARRSEVAEFLTRHHPVDFQLIYNSATAMAQHYFWGDMSAAESDPYRDVVLRAFQGMDMLLARTIAAAPPNARVFVFSECGAGPLRRGVDLNLWLSRIGLLQCRTTAAPETPGAPAGMRGVVRGLRHHAQRHLPLNVQRMLNHHLRPLKRWVQLRSELSFVDWSRTRAFARGKEGNLFVNLAGRESHGIVKQGSEYEAVRDELIEALLALREPGSDLPVVVAARRREDVFEGPSLANAPDVIVDWRNGEYMPAEQGQFGGEVFCERWREYMSWPTSGSHRANGIFLAAGPGIARGRLDSVRLVDLAPTLLHAAGVATPANLEGRVATGLFTSTGDTD